MSDIVVVVEPFWGCPIAQVSRLGAATCLVGPTVPDWGGSDGFFTSSKITTGVTCSGGNLSGTVVLDGLDGGCETAPDTATFTL